MLQQSLYTVFLLSIGLVVLACNGIGVVQSSLSTPQRQAVPQQDRTAVTATVDVTDGLVR